MRVRFGLGLRLVAREGEVEDRDVGVGDRDGSCDDPLYKIRCNNSMRSLFFNALNGSSYPITSTTPPPSALSSAPPPSPPPPPTSPLASIPRASSSTALSPSMSPVATPSCSSTTPLASSSPPINTTANDLAICRTFVGGNSSTSYAIWASDIRSSAYRNIVDLDAMGMSVALGSDNRERERGRLGS